jgi:uncharacterized membrane protein
LSGALPRLVLALAYPWLAHAASTRGSSALAIVALADLALVLLLDPLLRLRGWAWVSALLVTLGLALLAQSAYALLPLLLVPVAVLAFIAWMFGRTLRAGQVPLISRIVAALEGKPAMQLAPELQRYARRLTAAWSGLLATLALVNLLLALVAVPRGLLASAGVVVPWVVTDTQWSWIANLLNYGLVVGFFVGEFQFRKRAFPGRYASFIDFMRQMGSLGPAFWATLLR